MPTQTPAKYSRITVEAKPPVARISLRNPPLNVIDIPMMEELGDALGDIDSQSDVSAVVFSGEGKSFSAGVDVAAHTLDRVENMLAKFHSVIRALVSTKKVTIAAVQGHCLGGAAELAMVCDIVHTADTAQWGFPEIKLGCYPPVAVTALAALVGQKRAADLILTGRTITGVEAAAIGLANYAVPEDRLATSLEESIRHLVALSPAALAITKKAIYGWDSIHFDKGLARAEKIYLEDLIRSEDAQEGISAFLQKRAPAWNRK